MALITWSDAYSVGVGAMDEQHKGLVKALNELHAAMIEGKHKDATGPLLDRLLDYTRSHFSAEEQLLRRAKYPGTADQESMHKSLTGQVEKFIERHRKGEIALNVDLLTFLRDWLLNHIQKSDRDYGPWLNQHGVK